MQDKKLYSTIQVDIDGLWVIEKLLGKELPVEPDPVFDFGLERLLALLWEFGIKATFFVVAKDLESPKKVEFLRKLISQGHEIASHGLTHSYLTTITDDEARREINGSREKIERTLGIKVSGFKAPGFAASKPLAGMLEDAGYSYDSSVLATSCALLMQQISKVPYRKMGMLTAPAGPYTPSRDDIFKKGDSGIIEIPVTAAPFIRTPAHFSYMVLGRYPYAGLVRTLLKVSSPRVINFLFHPLDLMEGYSIDISRKVLGLDVDGEYKLEMARDMLKFLCRDRNVVTTRALCEILKEEHGAKLAAA